jgi:pSer/pThr/pTyr-binding forkhead associated (FHA) protein
VWRDGAQVYIRDVESTNGTFVNERKLPPETDHPLRIGDVVGFSADLRAVVQAPSDPPAGT